VSGKATHLYKDMRLEDKDAVLKRTGTACPHCKGKTSGRDATERGAKNGLAFQKKNSKIYLVIILCTVEFRYFKKGD
jgi:hypothetical protein